MNYDINTLATVVNMIDNRLGQLADSDETRLAKRELETLKEHLQNGIEAALDAFENQMGGE
jgi:hypothetical protein